MFLEEVSRSRKRDILLCTGNFRSLYRAISITAAARELARYKLHLVGVQEVRWDKGGTVRAGDYNFFYKKGNKNHKLPGIDQVTTELIKAGGRTISSAIHKLVTSIWNKEELPEEWKE